MIHSGSNGPLVGSYNRVVVLDAIRQAGGISRIEIAQVTRMTPQTVTNIVRRLLDEGLVLEDGLLPSTGSGKRRTVLRIDADGAFAIGIHLDPSRVTFVVLNLRGKPLTVEVHELGPDETDPAAVLDILVASVNRLVVETPHPFDINRFVGVGIAAPGAIDIRSGALVAPPNMAEWQHVPIRDQVGARTGWPVALDNDATAAAVGERWIGGASRAGSFAFLYVGAGIGCGLILEGESYRGVSGNAGEFGHIRVLDGTRSCHCGRTGCVETFASARAVLQNDGGVELGARAIADAAVSLVNLIDIDRIVIGGHGLNAAPDMAEIYRAEIEAAIAKLSFARRVRAVEVELALAGEQAGAIGAAALLLDARYSPQLSVLMHD